MIPLGKHYDKERYNCAHFVAEYYRENLNIEIPVVNEFGLSFVAWLRRNFNAITSPENNCLVLMITHDGLYHIGVYYNYGVYHNFKPNKGHGSVCKWTVGSVNTYYSKVSFHKWSQSDISNQ